MSHYTVSVLAELDGGHVPGTNTQYAYSDTVETSGYLMPGDGGGALYVITKSTAPADGTTIINVVGVEKKAFLVPVAGEVKAEAFGVVLDDTGTPVDRTEQFQKAVYYAADAARASRSDTNSDIKLTCAADFLISSPINFAKSDGGTAEFNVELSGRIVATGGGAFQSQFTAELGDGYTRSSDWKLRDPRNDVTYGGAEIVNVADLRPLPMFNMRIQRSDVHIAELSCDFWCSGVRYQSCTGTNFYIQELFSHRTYGHLTTHASNGAMKIFNCITKQWALGDKGEAYGSGATARVHPAGASNMLNYTGDCQVSAHKDWMVIGGFWGWSRTSNLLLDQTPNEDDPAASGNPGRDCYWDGLATGTSGKLSNYLTASQGTGDNIHQNTHVMQGFGNSSTSPRYDRIHVGGPVSIEVWNNTNRCFFFNCDIDASTIQLFGHSWQFDNCSYISSGSNKFAQFDASGEITDASDKVITLDPRVRVYAYGNAANPNSAEFIGIENTSIGVFPFEENSYDGDYSAWNERNFASAGSYAGAMSIASKPFIVTTTAAQGYLGLDSTNSRVGLNPAAGAGVQFLVAQDGNYGGKSLTRGQVVTALVASPGSTWNDAKWSVANYDDVDARTSGRSAEVHQRKMRLIPRYEDEPYDHLFTPAGVLTAYKNVGGNYWEEEFDGDVVTDRGSSGGFSRSIEGDLSISGKIKSLNSSGTLVFTAIDASNDELRVNSASGLSPANANTVILRKTGDARYGRRVAVPVSANASGSIGQWAVDSSYVYFCTANNKWRRVAIAAW